MQCLPMPAESNNKENRLNCVERLCEQNAPLTPKQCCQSDQAEPIIPTPDAQSVVSPPGVMAQGAFRSSVQRTFPKSQNRSFPPLQGRAQQTGPPCPLSVTSASAPPLPKRSRSIHWDRSGDSENSSGACIQILPVLHPNPYEPTKAAARTWPM